SLHSALCDRITLAADRVAPDWPSRCKLGCAMRNALPKSIIAPPPQSDEQPFEIGDTLTVYEAAMVYTSRHPHTQFLKGSDLEDHLTFLRAGIRESGRPSRIRARQRQSWDIFCELMKRIDEGHLRTVARAYTKSGQIDPTRTVIRTENLVQLAI